MATKKKTTKSNVSKSAKKQSFKFRWWMAVILVMFVAVVGIIVLSFTYAANWTGTRYSQSVNRKTTGFGNVCLSTDSSGTWCNNGSTFTGGNLKVWRREDGRCATINLNSWNGNVRFKSGTSNDFQQGNSVIVSETNSCS